MWTLQRCMIMNGTLNSFPCACGGVALLISAMMAEGYTVSPYNVRKALENACIPIGCLPEDSCLLETALRKLTENMNKFKGFVISHPLNYGICINQAGKSKVKKENVG